MSVIISDTMRVIPKLKRMCDEIIRVLESAADEITGTINSTISLSSTFVGPYRLSQYIIFDYFSSFSEQTNCAHVLEKNDAYAQSVRRLVYKSDEDSHKNRTVAN